MVVHLLSSFFSSFLNIFLPVLTSGVMSYIGKVKKPIMFRSRINTGKIEIAPILQAELIEQIDERLLLVGGGDGLFDDSLRIAR